MPAAPELLGNVAVKGPFIVAEPRGGGESEAPSFGDAGLVDGAAAGDAEFVCDPIADAQDSLRRRDSEIQAGVRH